MSSTGKELTQKKFLERKWRKFFVTMDQDHDKKITVKDYELMGQRFAAASNVSKERKAVIEQHFINLWNKVFSQDGKYRQVTEDELVDRFNEAGAAVLNQICHETCPLTFQTVDADGDGLIQVDEFRNFFRLFNKDESIADKSFETIDLDKDGVLSVEEFTKSWMEFMTGSDQTSPYQFMFGSLDE